jgi:hypothetical protein
MEALGTVYAPLYAWIHADERRCLGPDKRGAQVGQRQRIGIRCYGVVLKLRFRIWRRARPTANQARKKKDCSPKWAVLNNGGKRGIRPNKAATTITTNLLQTHCNNNQAHAPSTEHLIFCSKTICFLWHVSTPYFTPLILGELGRLIP